MDKVKLIASHPSGIFRTVTLSESTRSRPAMKLWGMYFANAVPEK